MHSSNRLLWTGSICSSVLSKLGKVTPIMGALLVPFFAARCSAGTQFGKPIYDAIKPSIVHVKCVSDNRSGTGFLWPAPDRAVTALHVVAGCARIVVFDEALGTAYGATISKVHLKADLALLKISGTPAAHALNSSSLPPPLTEQLSTLGYPLGVQFMISTPLKFRYGPATLRGVLPDSVANTLSGGSPSLDIDVDNIDGHLLPGHSGAPIFDGNQKVVAIADGGLENGAAAISWGIPAKYLSELVVSTDPISAGPSQVAALALFSYEGNAKVTDEISCSGFTLSRLQSVSFAQISGSVDDPTGLAQLVSYFGVDPRGFTFDVYQHLQSGATFVLPSGEKMSSDPDGLCVVTLPSGMVQIKLQLATFESTVQAQTYSQVFEQELVDNQPQNWVVDPAWTTIMPYSRFDGLTVRRRAYLHVAYLPAQFQDKYMFETLALRNHVFIGSAASYVMSPETAQRMNFCLATNWAGDCDAMRKLRTEWAQSVLAIQLTTFPIG